MRPLMCKNDGGAPTDTPNQKAISDNFLAEKGAPDPVFIVLKFEEKKTLTWNSWGIAESIMLKWIERGKEKMENND